MNEIMIREWLLKEFDTTETTTSIHMELQHKGTRDKENKTKTKKQAQQLLCSSDYKKEQRTGENKR